jgi:hypothetical protein
VVLPVLALVAAACGERRTGDLTVEHDSTPAAAGVEVVAIPDGPVGDSMRRAAAIDDSARAIDARFQAEREAINRDAAALTGDRRSPEYARRWEALRRRTTAAESLRAERDRMRRRAERSRPAAQRDTTAR